MDVALLPLQSPGPVMSSTSQPPLALVIAGLLALGAMGGVLGTAHAASAPSAERARAIMTRGDLPATVGFSEPIGFASASGR
jgi:hypothetical protein